MAINLRKRYGSRANPESPAYPGGSFKDETAPGADNGTPVENDWANDKEGFFQSLLSLAGITPNNVTDTAVISQHLNALTMYMTGTAPKNASPADICSEMPITDWSNPAAAPNYLNSGETIVDSCVGFDATLGRHFLFVAYGTSISTVVCWDYSASPALSSPLSISWATAPDNILSICSDGDYLYVMWMETGGNVMISKFSISSWTGNEIEIRDTGYDTTPSAPLGCRLCVADDDNLGVLIQDWTSPNHRVRIGVLSKDNVSWSSSQFADYETDFVSAKLISDGTYLYTLGRDEGSTYNDYALLRVDISNPATQDISAINSPVIGQYQEYPNAIHRVRDMVLITNMQGDVFGNYPTTGLTDFLFEALPFDYYDAGGAHGATIGSDGKNLLIQCIEVTLGATGYLSVFKIPISEFAFDARVSPLVALDSTRIRIGAAAAGIPSDAPFGKMLFDGRDSWLVTTQGYIYRLCNTGM